MPLGDGICEFFVYAEQRRVVLVPAVFAVKVRRAATYRVEFHRAYKVIERAERFTVRILVILFRRGEKPVPRREIVVSYARLFRKPVERVSRKKEQVCGLGYGQHGQRAVYRSVA